MTAHLCCSSVGQLLRLELRPKMLYSMLRFSRGRSVPRRGWNSSRFVWCVRTNIRCSLVTHVGSIVANIGSALSGSCLIAGGNTPVYQSCEHQPPSTSSSACKPCTSKRNATFWTRSGQLLTIYSESVLKEQCLRADVCHVTPNE